jgi:hypothetical protein
VGPAEPSELADLSCRVSALGLLEGTGMLNRRTILAAGIALPMAAEAASAKQLPANIPLIGAWTLIDAMTVQKDGQSGLYDGFPKPYSGLIVYDPTGMMAVQIARGRPPLPDNRDVNNLTVDQRLANFEGFVAYYGRYEFDPEESIVTHFVSSHLDPSRIGNGSVLRRKVVLVGDVVTLTTIPQATSKTGSYSVLSWRKV